MSEIKNSIIDKYTKILIFLAFILFISLIRINKVYGVDIGSEGDGNFTSGTGCPEGAMCVVADQGGYYFTIVKNYKKAQNGISYTRVSKTVTDFENDLGYQYKYNILLNDIKKGGDVFNRILSKTGISNKQFYDNDYYILVQPRVRMFYKTSNSIYYDTGFGYPADIARKLKNDKANRNDLFENILTRNLICMVKIDWPGDTVCSSAADAAREQEYLNLAMNNSRYGSAVIWAKEVAFKLQITKVDENDKTITSDSTSFALYNNDSCKGNPIRTLNFKESTTIELMPGPYSIKETKAPNGYDLNKTCYRNSNFEGGHTYGVSVKNPRSRGNIKIIKTDESGNKITSGKAKFNVYNGGSCGGNPIKTVDVTGEATISSLVTGTYSVRETAAPSGYEVNSTCKSVSVLGGKTNNVTIPNPRSKGNLKITKLDKETNKVVNSSAATFAIYKNSNCSGNPIKTQNVTGTATIPSLEIGAYSVKETKAPNNYELTNPVCKNVTVTRNSTSEIKFLNPRSKGNLKITKIDNNGNKITTGAATFNVYNNNNCSGTAMKTLNVTGEYILSSIDIGAYSVKETKAPEGYEVNTSCHAITVTRNNTNEIKVKDARSRGTLEITKVDKATKAPITSSTATFAIYKNNNCSGTPLQSITVKGKGSVSLEIGNYSFKETVAPKDYYLDDKTCYNNINIERNKPTSKTVEDEKKYGFLKINKLDEDTNQPITGTTPAKFNIYKGEACNGSVFRTVTVSNRVDEKVQLDIGKYCVKETVAPNGYEIRSNPQTITILDHQTTNDVPQKLTFKDRKSCKLEFSLIDKTSPAARIALYEKLLKRNNFSYGNLLKFDITDAEVVCGKEPENKNEINTGCLSCQNTAINFNEGNLSEYNKTENKQKPIVVQTSNGLKTAYCNVIFELKNNLKNNGGQNYEYVPSYRFESTNTNKKFKSGQMVLNRVDTNKTIAQGTITKTCYIYDVDKSYMEKELENSDRWKIDYNNYIKSISLNNIVLNSTETEGEWTIEEGNYNNNKYVKFTKVITATYDLNAVYSEIGSGDTKNCTSESQTCKLLGYGFETKLNTANGNYSMPFIIEVNNKNLGLSENNNKYSSDKCNYSIENDIIDKPDELNIEFRSIDTSNPFPGKSGSGRNVGTNWCSGNDCSKNNSLVQEMMNRNNSYNKNKEQKPIYTILLTPDIIKTMRNNYGNIIYDSYELECDEAGCKSKFLQNFGIVKNG